MISISIKQKEYIMASLDDNILFIEDFREETAKAFRGLLYDLEYDENKLSLNDKEKEIAIESLQDFQCSRFCEFDDEWNYIDNLLNYLQK